MIHLCAMLFLMISSSIGIFLHRDYWMAWLIFLEMMLLGVSALWVLFLGHLPDVHVFLLMILAISGAKVAIALTLLVLIHQTKDQPL